jgi:hypothetical protein
MSADRGNLETRIAMLEYKLENQEVRLTAAEAKNELLSAKLQEYKEDHDILIAISTKTEAIEKLLATLVTKNEFTPVRLITFGMIGICMTGILLGVLALIVKPGLIH